MTMKTKKKKESNNNSAINPTKSQAKAGIRSKVTSAEIPRLLQQQLVHVFQEALQARLTPDLPVLLQEVKGHLYARDFHQAFGDPTYREAYAFRWSPSRALTYLTIFCDLHRHILPGLMHRLSGLDGSTISSPSRSSRGSAEASCDISSQEGNQSAHISVGHPLDANLVRLHVTCLGGGGGAEAVALAGFRHIVHAAESRDLGIVVDIVDMADWSDTFSKLENVLVSPITSSPGDLTADQTDQTNQTTLVPRDRYQLGFHQHDLLDPISLTCESLIRKSDLITLLFTLNELYKASKSKATNFLLNLAALVKKDALLLVVDSPGSYSTVKTSRGDAATEKTYPMQWLLDHTLLSLARDQDDQAQWEKLVTVDSRWFRIPEGLDYPSDLENMRYQLHLFRRI